MTNHNKKGIALIFTLLTMTVFLILSSIFVLRTIHEKNMVEREKRSAQAFYVAEAGDETALKQLNTLINTYMLSTINNAAPQVVINDAQSYVASTDGLGFLVKYVKNNNVAQLTLNGSEARYSLAATNFGSGTYQYDIVITVKKNPAANGTDKWDFPYYFSVRGTGTVNGVSRKILLSGDFTVQVQRDNFAKFALLTNHHTLPNGTTVWFTSKTNFSGPVHTNERVSIAFNPSGTFDGIVTQQYADARFYNNGSPILVNADNNAPRDVPTFNAGFTRGVSAIAMATSVQKQDLINEARAGDTTPGNGIFIANSSNNLTGGIYVNGNSTLDMSVSNSNAVYTITQGATTKAITVDRTNNQTTVVTNGGSPQVYSGVPDGVDKIGTIVYADGSITSLGGTIQNQTELTISSESDVIISNHIKYSDYSPGTGTPGTPGYVAPSASGTKNLLGIVSWSGNVRIATTAPNDLNVHATLMSTNGVFTADNYNSGSPRGTVTLLGGIISNYYGAMGTFSGSTGQLLTGFGRNFVYDGRMLIGKSPPYFPSMQKYIAFTNDITDKIVWQEGGF